MTWMRFFASADVKRLAAAIADTETCDWEFGPYRSYCGPLDLTVWHANQGYGFTVWQGRVDNNVGTHGIAGKGGANGEALWHAYRSVGGSWRAERIEAILAARADKARPVGSERSQTAPDPDKERSE